MQTIIFKIVLIVLIIGLVGCANYTFTPDMTTLKYGQTGQDGDSLNGDYDSNNFTVTQTFKWSQ